MCVYTTTTFVFFFLGRKPRMIQWIICKLCETPPVLPPLSSFIILMISRTKCEILKNSKKISFLYKIYFHLKMLLVKLKLSCRFYMRFHEFFVDFTALYLFNFWSQRNYFLQICPKSAGSFIHLLLSRNPLIYLQISRFVLDENVLTNNSKFAIFLKQD